MTENDKHIRSADSHFARTVAVFAVAVGSIILVITSSALSVAQVAAIAVGIAVPGALLTLHFHEDRRRHREWTAILNSLPTPFALASAPGFFQQYAKLADALTKIVRHDDLLFRDLALTRLEAIADDLTTLARGQVVFKATETWRTAYQHVLETLRVKTYYSVAWVRTNDYWNDPPGRQSMQLNYELVGLGFRIERIHILPDELWPFEQKLPTGGILEWLVEQQGRGVIVSLARESNLASEPDLLRDFAIYGDRAMGIQDLDEQSHTVRFILSFDQPSIRQALTRWERLALFSDSFQNLLDP